MPATSTSPSPSPRGELSANSADNSPLGAADLRERRAKIDLPDGRVLSYTVLGSDDDPAVLVLDGPGSRALAIASAPHAAKLGLRLVAPDRPGFGESTVSDGLGIADWPRDHAALLDALSIERAGIVAQSGGTPFALAAAAALPDRVGAIAFVGALGPMEEKAVHADAGKELKRASMLLRRAPWLLRAGLKAAARSVAKDPETLARKSMKEMPPADAKVVEDPAMWAVHVQATKEILGDPHAFAREMGLILGPWGIDVGKVATPVAFWSGGEDVRHPTSHSRRLAELLGGAPVHVVPGAATFGMVAIYGDALSFASGSSRSQRAERDSSAKPTDS